MGKVTWNTTAAQIDAVEDDEGGNYYEGPVPPPSVYRFRLVEALVKKFSTGSQGIRLTLEIDDPRADKAKYSGARAWENIVDMESTTFKIKQFLNAIGATSKDWANTQAGADGIITKIGKVSLTGEVFLRGATKLGKNANTGETRFEVSKLLPAATEDDGGDDSGDDSDGDPAPF